MREGLFQGDRTIRNMDQGMRRIGGKTIRQPYVTFEKRTPTERRRAGRTAGNVMKAMALIKRFGL